MKSSRHFANALFITFGLVSFMPAYSYAGLKSFTMHSRANCVNNESISWQANNTMVLRTLSGHANASQIITHVIDTGWENTWRSAAVHWGEGRGGWLVIGNHYQCIEGNVEFIDWTEATDCSIYDGWWD